MSSLKSKICYGLKITITPIENAINRLRLKNDNFSIICATCAGGIIYHKLGKKFLSPTVNLWIAEKDIPKLVKNLPHYMQTSLKFIESDKPYPVAVCDDIKVYFNHAQTHAEAEEIWNRRRCRINYDNLWVIGSDNNMTYEDIEAFSTIPCKGKVMFTARDYPEFDFVLPFEEYKGKESVGQYMSNHTPVLDKFVFEKYFDYVRWLNTGKVIYRRKT